MDWRELDFVEENRDSGRGGSERMGAASMAPRAAGRRRRMEDVDWVQQDAR